MPEGKIIMKSFSVKSWSNNVRFAIVELEIKFWCKSLLQDGTISHFSGQLWGFMGGLPVTETDPLQVPAPAEFPVSWHWLIWCPLMESSHLPALLTHSVFCRLQTLSSDTEEVDIPYKCYTHSHEHRQSDLFLFMIRDASQLTQNKGCKYVLWRRVLLREKSVAVTKTTRGDWSNLQNTSFVEKVIFCLLIARM